MAQQLLQHPGVDGSVVDSGGNSALHYAACSGGGSSVEGLLQRGAQVAATDSRGLTPLHHAALLGHLGVVEQLVTAGADVHAASTCGAGTPLHLAIAERHWDVVACLLASWAAGTESAAGASPAISNSSDMASYLHLAAEAGHVPTIVSLLKAGADPCAVNSNGELALHSASRAGHALAAGRLIAAMRGSQTLLLNHLSAEGAAPVHLAAAGGHISMLAVLLRCREVEVDLKGAQGRTALHVAAAAGQVECVQLLTAAGADKDAVDEGGATPMQLAPLVDQPQLVALLATPSNIRQLVEANTLHTAAAGRQVGLVAALLAAGVPLTAEDSTGQSVLAVVLRQDHPGLFLAVVRHLLGSHPTATLPLGQEVMTAAQVYLGMRDACPGLLMQAAMEVMGEAGANALWRQLVQQHRLNVGQGVGTRNQQQQQQPREASAACVSALQLAAPQQVLVSGQHEQEQHDPGQQLALQTDPSQQGVLAMLQQHQQQQQQFRLGYNVVEGLLQAWLAARSDLAQQREGWVCDLQEYAHSINEQHTTPASASAHHQQLVVVVGAGACSPVLDRPSWAGNLVPPSAIAAAVAAAAAPGARSGARWQELQDMLQQLPPVAYTYGMTAALGAAAVGGHKDMCGRLLQQLLATLSMDEAVEVLQGVVSELEGAPSHLAVLGSGSLVLCEWLLGSWHEVRRQQQQELVDAVVSVVGLIKGSNQG